MSLKEKTSEIKEVISSFKEKMNKLLTLAEQQSTSSHTFKHEGTEILNDCFLYLMDIRDLNCEIQKGIELNRELTNKEKGIVDEKNLSLQNILYQRENINNKINSCRNFPTNELNKIILPETELVEEFLKKKQRTNQTVELIDKLNYELQQRKAYQEQVEKLNSDLNENLSKLKEKENFLKELPSNLSNLEFSTLKAQELLNLKLTETNKYNNLADNLPPPLFVLYNSLNCISNSNTDMFNFEIKILGKEEKIDEFYEKYSKEKVNFTQKFLSNASNNIANKEEGEHEGGDEAKNQINYDNERKLKKKKYKIKLNNNKNCANNVNNIEEGTLDKISKFPLFVQFNISYNNKINNLNFNFSDDVEYIEPLPLTINFYFIPVLNLITTELISQKYNTSQFLSNIFLPSLNLVNITKVGIEKTYNYLCDETNQNEKFFDYIQIMGNNVYYNYQQIKNYIDLVNNKINSKKLNTMNDSDYNNTNTNITNTNFSSTKFETSEYYLEDPNKVNTDSFISLLSKRIKSIPLLIAQLDYLQKNLKIIPEILAEIKLEKKYQLIKDKTNLIYFDQTTQKEFLSLYSNSFDIKEDNLKIAYSFEKNSDDNYTKRYIQIPITSYNEEEAMYYKLEMERNSFNFAAIIEIGLDYPNTPPKFILSLNMQKSKQNNVPESLVKFLKESNQGKDDISKENDVDNFGYSNVLRDMEEEINVHYKDFCSNENSNILLSYQIRHLQMCIDIFTDTENTTKISSNYSKPFKGFLKKRPFCYNEVKNIFEAR